MNESEINDAKDLIHELYNSLSKRTEQSNEILDITDVLLQVYKKLDITKNPEALVNRLIQYIRSVSLKGKISYPPTEEKLVIQLGEFAKKAGLNGLYRGDFSDKSQFYNLTEQMPRHS